MIKQAFVQGFVRRHGVVGSLGKKDTARLLLSSKKRGVDSIIALPGAWLSKKILGDKRATRVGTGLHKIVADIDTIAGRPLNAIMEKGPGFLKNIFKQKEMIRTGKDTYKKVKRPSITAPLHSLSQIAVPMIAADAMIDKMNKYRERKKSAGSEAVI